MTRVSARLLPAAMAALDAETRKPRGYLLLRALEQPDSVLFTLDTSN